ncbi:ABC transporter substrate-binding protein [Microbacterium nymphoidis]|uniref:ABC transporter substrate-binding protein n=1 Tax=Microbacterium nymphoidis TaxID=2898586 RepID=UPI001E51A2A3|nr:extracellular solute-binding protein [Microbacterium nymphoidis]MCD2497926.1 extracellular solute-binding protein [Microbacterium nymphoidis]
MFSKKRIAAVAAITGAALALAGCGGGADAGSAGGAATLDPNEKVTLTFTWWGNDDRADRYNQLIEKFNEEYPNITINGTFTDFPSYWEKRQTEAAGGGLPDVWQFSDSYLRQYGQAGYLLDLNTVSDVVDMSTFEDSLKGTGQLGDKQYSLPTGYSLWANFINTDLLTAHDLTPPVENATFADFDTWMKSVTDKTGGAVYGGTDYTQRIQQFELKLRSEGKNLYTDDGQLGFDEDELKEFWSSGDALRDGITIPQSKLEEINPKSGFGAGLTASEMSWSNFLGGYLADSGASSIELVAPPTYKVGSKDLYRQGGLQMAISAKTKHPAAAAAFLNFVVNSPEAGEIFGTTLGFPASSSKLAGTTLEGVDKQVADYIESAADRIGDAPPPAVVGYGALEQKFWDLGKALGLGSITVDEAVKQFFDEAKVTLG